MSDIEIARAAVKKPIQEIGLKLGIPEADLLPFGHDKAKVTRYVHQALAGREGWQADPGDGDQPDACG